MGAVQVAIEVAELVGQEDLALLAEQAAVSFECVVCSRPGRLPQSPAAVVILRDGTVLALRLAHVGCASSGVVEVPGLAAVLREADAEVLAIAAVLPHADGPRPVLVVETTASVSSQAEHNGDRVDAVLARMLAQGFGLITRAGSTPEHARGWLATVAGGGLRLVDPAGWVIYEGVLVFPQGWLALAGRRGDCVVLVGTGLGLSQILGDAGDGLARLNTAARAGRLAGGLVAVAER